MSLLGYLALGTYRVPLYGGITDIDGQNEYTVINTADFPYIGGNWTEPPYNLTVERTTYPIRFGLPEASVPFDGLQITTIDGTKLYPGFLSHTLVESGVGDGSIAMFGELLSSGGRRLVELSLSYGVEYKFAYVFQSYAGILTLQAIWTDGEFGPGEGGRRWAGEAIVKFIGENSNIVNVTSNNYRSIVRIYPDKRVPVNFYRTKDGEYTSDPITLNRGESSGRLTFDIVFDDGTVTPYSGEVLFDPPGNNDFSVEINSITALETATRYETVITAKPVLYPEVFDLITLLIPDNLGPYGPGGFSKPEGGDGSFSDGDSEDIRGDVPNGSKESNSSSTGLFTRYAMSSADLYVVGAALYTENILAAIGKEIMSFLWNSPSDALISLISYPFDVSSLISTTSTSVKFGSLNLEAVTGARLNGTFAQIDWGSIQLEEFWGNFLDYAPHTKIELYLPWCTGFVSIDPHECLPGSISVITNIEISKGTCVHNVFGNKGALIGTYSGTCGSQLPMTAIDTSGKALALVTAAAGALVAGAAAGGATSAGIAAANSPQAIARPYFDALSRGLDQTSARLTAQRTAISAAEAPYRAVQQRASQASLVSAAAAIRTPASIQRNGSFSGNGAGMGIQYPFIIISRPEQNVPENYGRFYGYPSNVYTSLGSIRGYTEVGSVHVNGLSGATLEEIEEIENLLHGGVIL